MKKVYILAMIGTLVTCLTGIPEIMEGIAERGPEGVNYGRILFPLLLGGGSFWLYRREK